MSSLLCVLAHPDDEADVLVNLSALLDRKEAAALCHGTQYVLFVRRRSQEAGHTITVRDALLTEVAFGWQWPASPVTNDPMPWWLGQA